MTIGWVIFWKCVVVGVWAGLVERWAAFKRKRREQGLPLKYNRRTGTYVVHDWTEHVDRTAYWLRTLGYGSIFLLWTVLGGAFLIGGKEGARALVLWFL